jgi:hypothetical protein
MNPIALDITFADGTTKKVVAAAADLIGFETHFDKSVATLQTDYRLTYLVFIAWHALKRQGDVKSEFDDFVNTVSNIEASDDEKK